MAKPTKIDKELITFTLLDESVVSYGFRVLIDGVDLSQFIKNPVMFYIHLDKKLPIGMWVNIRKEGGRILADALFDYDDPDPEVQRIIGKVERGFIRMASAGLVDFEFSDDKKLYLKGQKLPTMIKSRMRESSIVNIGANHNALRLYDKKGGAINLSDGSDFFEKTILKSNNMNKVKAILKLSDTASEEDVLKALTPMINLSEENKSLKETNTTLQSKIDQIELAEKTAKTETAKTAISAAIKDGRLSEDKEGNTMKFWLSAYDANYDLADTNLNNLPKRKSVTIDLSDEKPTESAFAIRQKEIEDKNKNQRK